MKPVWVHLRRSDPPVAVNANNVVYTHESAVNKTLTLFLVNGKELRIHGLTTHQWLAAARRAARP